MPLDRRISIGIAIVIVVSSFSGCLWFDKTTFSLIASIAYDDDGFASLSLTFNASDVISLTLSGPDTGVVFSDTFYRGTTTATIPLASYRAQPSPGSYLLQVHDDRDNQIFEKEYFYEGENLAVSRVVAQWWNEHVWEETQSLVGLNITVTNHGDLPAYPHRAEVTVANKSASGLVLPDVVLPGHTTTRCCFVYIEDVPQVQQVLNLVVKNTEETVMTSTSYLVSPEENVSTLNYSWRYRGNRYLSVPDPDCLVDYYSRLDRLVVEDYAAYVFDGYDDHYVDMIVEKFLDLFDHLFDPPLDDVDFVNAVASFVQNMEYAEDDPADPECEYPRYPLEMLKVKQGDCEDTAILAAALLDTMGYNVTLLRLPDHMAVGVHLDENASHFEYYIAEYYYLETTRENWLLGRVPSEYSNTSNVTIYPISSRPLLLHKWKNATRYTSTDGKDFVKMKILVENIGSGAAEDAAVKGAFFAEVTPTLYYNQEVAVISSLDAREKKEVYLEITVPKGVATMLKTQLFLNNTMVDEKESTSLFT